MFQGDEVAAVAADTEERAMDAVRLIKVEYEMLPHLASVDQALSADAPEVFEGGNAKRAASQETGDIDAGFKAAAHVVDATYSTQVSTHVCLETHGSVCEWDGDKLTAWVSTQAVHGTREGFAPGAEHSADQRARHHRVHGRRLRQQVRPRRAGLICARLAQEGERCR